MNTNPRSHRRSAIARRPGAVRLRVEPLEPRTLLAAPAVDVIPAQSVPIGKTVIVPVTGSDAGGNPLTYTATSSNPQISARFHTGNPYLKVSVANFGALTFQLFQDLTPNTVQEISGLVNQGFYNGLTFHRVVPNFVIQGGDPNGNGTGGPGFTFDDEFNPAAIFDGTGQLAMANAGKDTNGSQFFVTIGPQRALDFNHTIFGQLVRGFDVLNKIDMVPTDANNKPLTPVVITSASIVPDPTDGVLTVAATPAATGSATITVTANDGNGGTATQAFQVQAVADTVNDPPILGPVSDQATPAGTPVTFGLSGTDLEHDPLSFEAVALDNPAHGTVSVQGSQVTVTPSPGFTGPIHLLVGVKDQGATSRGSTPDPFDTQKITVHVGPTAPGATSGPAPQTFIAPDLSGLLRAAGEGHNTPRAGIKRMLGALQAQLISGPLADLDAGRVDGQGFAAEVSDLVTQFKQNVDQQLLPAHPHVAGLLKSRASMVDADVAALDQQDADGLIASATLADEARGSIHALTARQPQSARARFETLVDRTRSFEEGLHALVQGLGTGAAPPLTIQQVDATAMAEANAYRAGVDLVLAVHHPFAARAVDTAATAVEQQIDGIAQGNSVNPTGADVQSRVAAVVTDFDGRVLDTRGLLGPLGPFGGRFHERAPRTTGGATQPPPPSNPAPTPAPPSTPSDATTAFLFTPVPDSAQLAMHIHPHLSIVINGQQQTIPANIGFTPQGFLPIHTHDSSGLIHVESPEVHTFRLKDFFAIWQHTFNDPNIVFTSQDILGHQVDASHQITMTVNGQPSTAFENQVLNNPDGTLFSNGGLDIVIGFGPK